MIIQAMVDAIIQVIIFAILPFLIWVLFYRKREKFMQWIGLKKAIFQNSKKAFIISVLSFTILLVSGVILLFVMDDRSMIANAHFASLGMNSILLVLIYAVVQTGLSEEVLFRGFLLKRFSNWWGFGTGNMIQALLFGLLHGVILFPVMNLFLVIVIIGFAGLSGWMMGYVNEKLANGSILPSWMIHSLMNISSSLLIAFNIL